jgi:hypothetical protein
MSGNGVSNYLDHFEALQQCRILPLARARKKEDICNMAF